MFISVETGSFAKLLRGVERDMAKASTTAMRDAAGALKSELREQIVAAGLGARLANTWRGEVYPERSESVTPAGYVWSNAPSIVDAFSRGATIRPINGANYLWIPTKNVPRARGRVNRRGLSIRGGAMSPEEVENFFNTDFEVVKGKGGGLLAFMDVLAARAARGYRPKTKTRLAQGRTAKQVLMFVLRRTVTMPKKLDLDGPAQRAARVYGEAFARNLA